MDGKVERECIQGKESVQCELGPLTPSQRREEAFEKRRASAMFERNLILEGQNCNNDESLYRKKFASYSKALPHDQLGEVDLAAYNTWIKALTTGNPEEFELIPIGGTVKLANPQGSYAYDMAGPDSHHLAIKAPPSFSSPKQAGEMVENYWMALTRDVPFNEFERDSETLAAAEELSKLSDFDGPKCKGKVTPQTLFRGGVPGDLEGPYVSQFLLKDIPYGTKTMDQKYRTTLEGSDFMASYEEWLAIQNGKLPSTGSKFDPIPRYIRNGRDLAEWVRLDFTFQGVLSACLILQSFGREAQFVENPYLYSKTQGGFVTFGAPHVLDFSVRAARTALEAAWFQKFLVHRRLRPEEFGGRIQNLMTGKACYPIDSEVLQSEALSRIFRQYGNYLLPIAYPEGCPTHPAYPAGHACIAGAGVTILKAFFREDYIIPKAVEASSDGLTLLPYLKQGLTVGGELNKLASNIALGRDTAGVHWRTDGMEGLILGEDVAIGILQDYRDTYNEKFGGFSFTKFDGTRVII